MQTASWANMCLSACLFARRSSPLALAGLRIARSSLCQLTWFVGCRAQMESYTRGEQSSSVERFENEVVDEMGFEPPASSLRTVGKIS